MLSPSAIYFHTSVQNSEKDDIWTITNDFNHLSDFLLLLFSIAFCSELFSICLNDWLTVCIRGKSKTSWPFIYLLIIDN